MTSRQAVSVFVAPARARRGSVRPGADLVIEVDPPGHGAGADDARRPKAPAVGYSPARATPSTSAAKPAVKPLSEMVSSTSCSGAAAGTMRT